MRIKILLTAVLSLSISCFAESGGEKTKSSAESNQQAQSLQSDLSIAKEDSQSTPNPKAGKKSSMVDFCKKNTC